MINNYCWHMFSQYTLDVVSVVVVVVTFNKEYFFTWLWQNRMKWNFQKNNMAQWWSTCENEEAEEKDRSSTPLQSTLRAQWVNKHHTETHTHAIGKKKVGNNNNTQTIFVQRRSSPYWAVKVIEVVVRYFEWSQQQFEKGEEVRHW